MDNNKFTQEEKIEYFEEIASHFYNVNFGQFSKPDMELLMFSFYIKKKVEENKNEDGTVDYGKISDYIISKELGITQQRVTSLKKKCQLIYPIEFDWKKALANLIKNARYDSVTRKITLNIPDPNLAIEINNFIETKGAYFEKQLNSKILQIRVEYFIELMLELEGEETRKKIIKELKEQFSSTNKEEHMFDEKHIGKSLIKGVVDISSIAAGITNVLSPSNLIGKALMSLLV